MQLKKLSPLAGLILTGLLSACGGGGGDEPPPPAAPPPLPAITVSALSLDSTTPKSIADTSLKFSGGVCSGGTGTLTAAWDFGDGTGNGAYAPHKYLDSAAGTRAVTVTCTDTAGTTAGVATLQLNVLSAAMNGFLGRNWTPYAALETNVSPYPVAGIASVSGDVYGVWIRRNLGDSNEVASGQTTSSQTNWTVANTTTTTTSDKSPYSDSDTGFGHTAPIDMAVSPDGRGLAAWIAGTGATPNVFSIYYATRTSSIGWPTTATKLSVPGTDGAVINASIKVVINDAGNGAIGYCTSSGAFVAPYFSNVAGTPKKISNQCDVLDNSTAAYQLYRTFDIAIENNSTSKLYAVGVLDATPVTTTIKHAVAEQTYSASGGWTTISRIANGITTAPSSLSLSLSPNGTHRAIAWGQLNPINAAYSNIYTSMWGGTTWGTVRAFSHDITPTTSYDRPLVAVNNDGDAFMTMRLANSNGKVISAANYNGLATSAQWSTEVAIDNSGEYRATDIAIDNWGTGLVTNVDANFRYTQAGTFAKKPGVSQWSGFKVISSARPDTVYYNPMGYHYQTMRALPDGRAILVTSLYDQRPISSERIPSGYMMLK